MKRRLLVYVIMSLSTLLLLIDIKPVIGMAEKVLLLFDDTKVVRAADNDLNYIPETVDLDKIDNIGNEASNDLVEEDTNASEDAEEDKENIDVEVAAVSEVQETEEAIVVSLSSNEEKQDSVIKEAERTETVQFKDHIISFEHPLTGEVETINITRLMDVYDNAEELGDWDIHYACKDIRTRHYWLVDVHGFSEEIACSVIGNCSCEARFGQRQYTYNVYKNMDDVKTKLEEYSDNVGYGCAQWTTRSRRLKLLTYYQEAAKLLNDMNEIMIVAECCFLVDELESYNIFDDLYSAYDIEDATGRIAVLFEAYDGSAKEFKADGNGVFSLVKSNCSGEDRLMYAKNIYEYYN